MESLALTRLAGNFVDLMAGMGMSREDMDAVARLMRRHVALVERCDAPGPDELRLALQSRPPMN